MATTHVQVVSISAFFRSDTRGNASNEEPSGFALFDDARWHFTPLRDERKGLSNVSKDGITT